MQKPKIALIIGILCISVFPILVKLNLTPGLISAFYRMAFALVILTPIALFLKKFKIPSLPQIALAFLCGILFGSDVAVWNISIQESSATQASLLTNLSPIWVGIASFLWLKPKPKINFWIGTLIAFIGMVTLVGFQIFSELNFDKAFNFGILSGIFYAAYLLISKKILTQIDVISFMILSLFASTIHLGIICLITNEPFTGFSSEGWMVLVIQAVVCQLGAWLLISYTTQHMKATTISLSLLAQAIITAVMAYLFLNEQISLQMILGGLILLLGIRITFLEHNLSLKKILKPQ
ncbi:DMT family transporter [Flavobacterium sp.]|uniref:DMT family transporter n=1 Tax=Flavobacterium sp. TaxID=239 RepID=UPI00260CEDB0|nr:DMT family transporter [Flavobacterium sp.]MDD3003770.1 DMT family transporter [Flavobacterium sp.]